MFIVLMVLALITTLVGAFLSVNRANFALVRSSGQQERAYQACLSALAYGTFRLEHDRSWGAVPFEGGSDPYLPSMQIQEVAGSRRLTGHIATLEQSFELEVINRLDSAVGDPATGCPAQACLFRIEGSARGARRHLEVIYRKAPFFDTSAISNRRMDLDAEALILGSKDPYRSLVRSNEDIYAPDAVTDDKIHFTPKIGAVSPLDQPPHGSLWARTGIRSGNHNLADPSKLAQAQANALGSFVPAASRSKPITRLEITDLIDQGSEKPLPPGSYIFEELKMEVMENLATIDASGTPQWSGWTAREVKTPALIRRNPLNQITDIRYLNDESFATASAPDFDPSDLVMRQPVGWQLPSGTPAPLAEGTGLASDQGRFEWPGSGVFFTLKTSDVAIPDGHVKIPGDVVLASSNQPENQRPAPNLQLGTRDTTVNPPVSTPAGLEAEGNLEVLGSVQGYGALVASRDVTVAANGYSELISSPDQGVAIFGGRDVNLLPNPRSYTTPGMKQAFFGLVYAENDFRFWDHQSTTARWDLKVEGALVAHSGRVNIANANRVEFVYNPAYLNHLLKNLAASRVKLETVCWRL